MSGRRGVGGEGSAGSGAAAGLVAQIGRAHV